MLHSRSRFARDQMSENSVCFCRSVGKQLILNINILLFCFLFARIDSCVMHESGRKGVGAPTDPNHNATYYGDCIMANTDLTSFLANQSVALIEPQDVLRSIKALLSKKDRLEENAALASSLLQIADDMIQEVANSLDEFTDEPVRPNWEELMRQRQDATCH